MGGNVSVQLDKSSAGPEGAATGNTLSVTASSGATAAITGNTSRILVDIVADAACFILIAAAPTAIVDTSYYLPANVIVRVPMTDGNKIAAITASGTANLYYHIVQQASS